MNDGIGNAVGLVLKTWPFVVIRGAVLLVFSLVALIWWGLMITVMSHFQNLQGPGLLFFFALFAAPAGMFVLIRKYILYILKLAHVACLTELILGRSIPEEGMIAYGKEVVTKKFMGA